MRKLLITVSFIVIILVTYGVMFFCFSDVSFVTPTGIGEHAQQFGGAHVFKKNIRFCFQVIWLTCI